jgi:hypothetical protein
MRRMLELGGAELLTVVSSDLITAEVTILEVTKIHEGKHQGILGLNGSLQRACVGFSLCKQYSVR